METAASSRIDVLLRDAGSRIDPVDARALLACVLGQAVSWLFGHDDATVDVSLAARFAELVARRADGEPVAYLTGQRGFWTFALQVDPHTLIPRPETELLVEQALARMPSGAGLRVLDLGTGSGAIALALAVERPGASVLATDASDGALSVARRNARALAVDNVRFLQADWWTGLEGECFDLVVSNPPYIASSDPHLALGDLRHEPVGALVSGADGLDAIRVIVAEARTHLSAEGWLLLEHGWEQGRAVRGLLETAGFHDVATVRDLERRERVTLGRRGGAGR